jgi:hypothetical protein
MIETSQIIQRLSNMKYLNLNVKYFYLILPNFLNYLNVILSYSHYHISNHPLVRRFYFFLNLEYLNNCILYKMIGVINFIRFSYFDPNFYFFIQSLVHFKIIELDMNFKFLIYKQQNHTTFSIIFLNNH